jgi:hypothetical protein
MSCAEFEHGQHGPHAYYQEWSPNAYAPTTAAGFTAPPSGSDAWNDVGYSQPSYKWMHVKRAVIKPGLFSRSARIRRSDCSVPKRRVLDDGNGNRTNFTTHQLTELEKV